MKYAIVLPAGSGKTTLSNKYKELVDIDKLLFKEEKELLKEQYKKSHNNDDWFAYIDKEFYFLNKKIEKLSDKTILLLHHKSKAEKYNLEVLGSYKVSEDVMYQVAKERSLKDKFLGQCTIHNWYNSGDDCEICGNHLEIEDKIKYLINKYIVKNKR